MHTIAPHWTSYKIMSRHYTRQQIEALVQITGGTDKARDVLAALGAQAGTWYLQTCDEIAHARHLLSQHTPRRDIVTRLMQRFGLAERSAWRRVSEALQKPLS